MNDADVTTEAYVFIRFYLHIDFIRAQQFMKKKIKEMTLKSGKCMNGQFVVVQID